MKQQTFPFYNEVQDEPLSKHLEHCDSRCEYAGPDCIDYCKKYDIARVDQVELTKLDREGKDILL